MRSFFSPNGNALARRKKWRAERSLCRAKKKKWRCRTFLKDGADSVGVFGATIRVYVNIGMFSEYWLTRHNHLVGLTPQKPFEIPYAQEHSVFWRATEERVGNIAAFFRRLQPYHLADAPGGAAYITADETVMTRGKLVRRELRELSLEQDAAGQHRSTIRRRKSMAACRGLAAQFSREQFSLKRSPLSPHENRNEFRARSPRTRKPVTSGIIFHRRRTRSCLRWTSWIFNPFDQAHPIKFSPKDKNTGPGYYRTPSLVSLWSSAPFLHNNALGKFTGDPSVAGRMDAFNDAVEKLLWPEKRLEKINLANAK